MSHLGRLLARPRLCCATAVRTVDTSRCSVKDYVARLSVRKHIVQSSLATRTFGEKSTFSPHSFDKAPKPAKVKLIADRVSVPNSGHTLQPGSSMALASPCHPHQSSLGSRVPRVSTRS